MKRKSKFIVSLELPQHATVAEARDYIETAVCSWHGSLFPGDTSTGDDPDPMFNFDPDTVTVRAAPKLNPTEELVTRLEELVKQSEENMKKVLSLLELMKPNPNPRLKGAI